METVQICAIKQKCNLGAKFHVVSPDPHYPGFLNPKDGIQGTIPCCSNTPRLPRLPLLYPLPYPNPPNHSIDEADTPTRG